MRELSLMGELLKAMEEESKDLNYRLTHIDSVADAEYEPGVKICLIKYILNKPKEQ